MNIAQQIKRQLDAKRTEAAAKYKEFDDRRKEALESGVDLVNDKDAFGELHALNQAYSTVAAEVAELEQRMMQALEMDGEKGAPQHELSPTDERAKAAGIWTPGLRLVQNETYKQLAGTGRLTKQTGVELPSIEVANRDEFKAMLQGKALVTGASDTSAGAFVTADRQGYYPLMFAPYSIRNLVTVGETDSDLVEWVQENSFTNAAAEVAEATDLLGTGAKPESAIDFAIKSSTVQTIAHWIPATKRALDDAGQLRTIIDQRMQDGVYRRLETQIVSGNGAGTNLRGILNTVGISTVAKGAGEPAVEAILRAITAVRLAFMEPSAIALHPNDFVEMRLAKDANGNYIMGPPNLPGPAQLWGVPVVSTTSVTEGTGLVGKFDEAILWVREGVTISATDSHADFFTHNLVAILAEGRFAFGVPRPAAFCSVTAI